MTPGAASRSEGFGSGSPKVHVFRNHSVGSTRSRAASGPRLCTVMLMRMSSGLAFAYSTNTSKYRSSWNTPVSTQLVLELLTRAAAVGLDKVRVGELALRVLVEVLHVRVRGRAVEIEVVLLDVLAVVALAVGQAEQPLLQDGVALVPERQRKAQPLLVVAEATQAVLAPPIGARAGLVVREVVPGVAVVAVVLADGAPLPLAEVRPPLLPGDVRLARLVQPLLLGDVNQRVHVMPLSTGCASP